MKKERIEEIAAQFAKRMWPQGPASRPIVIAVSSVLSSLPEFAEPRWIKCSQRMPEPGKPIYAIGTRINAGRPFSSEFSGGVNFLGLLQNFERGEVTHWMPREVPAPPHPEDSELVKELLERKERVHELLYSQAINDAIEIVKRHESQKGKE